MITMFNVLKTDKIPFLYEKISTFGFLHSYNTRNKNLRIPICYNAFFSFNFVYWAIKTYNETPNEIKNINNFNNFKTALKKHLTRDY